jgi:hypothetical protein
MIDLGVVHIQRLGQAVDLEAPPDTIRQDFQFLVEV